MNRYVLSPRAKKDVEEIWEFTETRWNLKQAESYIRQLQTDIERVADRPNLGRPCDRVRPGYYRYLSGSHVIFYRLIDGGIDVVRILHQRMDAVRHLE